MTGWPSGWVISLGLGLGLSLGPSAPLLAQPSAPNPPPNPFSSACPLLFKSLVPQLLAELPSEINRTIQRQWQPGDPRRYLILFSAPDYNPLPWQTIEAQNPELALNLQSYPSLSQLFLTSLERVYGPQGVQEEQTFHWLFFQLDDRYHWQLVALLSQPETGMPHTNLTSPLAQTIQHRLERCYLPEE